MPTKQVTFEGAQGQSLSARLELPAGAPKAVALFAHCFSCGKDSSAAVKVSRALAARGVATLRFDFTGLGGSAGDFAETTFSTNLDDLVAAADHLRANLGAPAILIGHSLGGAAVLAAAERVPEARAVVTIGAPSDVAHVTHNFAEALPEIEASGEASVKLGGRDVTLKREFVRDLQRHPLLDRVRGLRKALLIMHSPTDAVVGIENAAAIFLAAKHPKSFVSLDNADHFLSRAADSDYAAGVIAAWAQRYAPIADQDQPAAPAGEVIVEETGAGLLQNRVRVGAHSFIADEPKSIGGDETGPTPYDLLAASIGACKSMTMRLYAQRKGYALDRISVSVSHNRIHAQDCADCETKDGHVDEFVARISLQGALSEDDRARVLAIAERCPVHRTLESEVKVRTQPAQA
ncbi:MAG: alpha/beta fold hydrolase [Alphaproteobacteria bacterium]|nr:alpha/beta fold hydrolase [Alphaproteobacteria bacterium]